MCLFVGGFFFAGIFVNFCVTEVVVGEAVIDPKRNLVCLISCVFNCK